MRLLKVKESKNESKLKNLEYEKLEGAQYLTTMDVKMAKTLFRYRSKMAQYSGNFKGKGPVELCPLCGTHSDLQEMSFKCPVVLKNIELNEDYENLFKTKLSKELAENLLAIVNVRGGKE